MNLLFKQRIRFRLLCLLKLDYDELIYGIEPCVYGSFQSHVKTDQNC
jgi:hypothetical protein